MGWIGSRARDLAGARRAELDRRTARQERLAARVRRPIGPPARPAAALPPRLLGERFFAVVELRHRDRPRIVAAGDAHQRLDARVDRRVGGEQIVNSSRGLSTHISITAEVAPSSSPRPSILRSAEIIASGFLVSSTEPASARNSRERDSAKRMTTERNQASAISAIAIRMARSRRRPCGRCRREEPPTAQPTSRRGTTARKTISATNEIDAGDDDRDHHHAHVAVADVGEFVAEHRLDLGVVERCEQAASSP